MLKLFESTNYTESASFGTGPNGVTDIKWHSGLNQIFVGNIIIKFRFNGWKHLGIF
jgi:hypothetical protein